MILTAKEAKEKTFNNIKIEKIIVDDELKKIHKLINKAVIDGLYAISGEGSLKDKTIKNLKKLEYYVVSNESYWSIIWSD